MGLEGIRAVQCIFQRNWKIIICYGEDHIVFSENASAIDKCKEDLSRKFQINDLGTLSKFLGIELDWSKNGIIKVRQSGPTKTFLNITGMTNTRPVASPINHSLTDEEIMYSEALNLEDHKSFQSIVVSIIYIAVQTQSDLCVAANMLESYV